MATGRSDYPNQISNVLAFRGALDAGGVQICEEMKLAAARAIADLVEEPTAECIVPRLPGGRRRGRRRRRSVRRLRRTKGMTRHWRIADGIAWAGEEDRVALIDTGPRRRHQCLPHRSPRSCGNCSSRARDPEADLQAKGAELADESGRDLVEAFIEAMAHHDLIESVASGT